MTKLNALLEGHDLKNLPLEQLVIEAHAATQGWALYNNAAQHWNHWQFWLGMRPPAAASVPSELERLIRASFGSLALFKEQFIAAGLNQFGSGWVWLAEKDGALAISTTANADNPLIKGERALIGCDVWEHAYYIDYRNGRGDFLKTYVDQLLNWEEAARHLSSPVIPA